MGREREKLRWRGRIGKTDWRNKLEDGTDGGTEGRAERQSEREGCGMAGWNGRVEWQGGMAGWKDRAEGQDGIAERNSRAE